MSSEPRTPDSFGWCATISKATKVISVLDRDLVQQKRRMVSTRRRKLTGLRRIASAPSASTRGGTVPAGAISGARHARARCGGQGGPNKIASGEIPPRGELPYPRG